MRRGDRLFKSLAAAAGLTIVIAIALIAIFLLVRAVPSLRANHANFFTSAEFNTTKADHLAFGIRDLFMVTVLSSVSALLLAVPIAVGIAVFLTQYAPKRLARPFAAMVDLLAAVPSIIFGLWGIFVLAPKVEPIAAFLNRNLGWLFLFRQGNVSLAGGGTIFTAGIVLSVMILPIITSVSREVFRQTPRIQMEAAQALGATKWEVVRMTVLPFGRSGVIAASMLGLGRALGETVAVLIILRSAARAGRLVAVRRWLHLRFQDRLRGSRIQRTAAHRGLHRRGICAVRPDIRRQRAGAHDRRREGQRMTAHALDQPVKAEVFRPLSLRRRITNNAATTFFVISFAVALVPLVWVLSVVVARGWYAVTRSGWWTHSLRGVLPEEFAGGVYHALYGTLVQAGVAALLSVPLGLMTAVFLVEYGSGRLVRLTTFMVDVLAGVPSIVAALFIFSLWIATLGFEQSSVAVSLALVLLMLPVVVRSTEEMLRLVPDDLREASYALGVPKWKTIVRIVFPIAMPGIVSGVLLAVARVIGETAPVLVLVGYSRSINYDIFHGNMASLPLLIYSELTNPEHAGFLRIWGAALSLIILVAVINLLAAAFRFMSTRRR